MFLRNAIKNMLYGRGIVISRPPGQFNVDLWKLSCLKKRGGKVAAAVDGGAATGKWTKMLRSVYNDAKVLCVEPRQSAFLELERWSQNEDGVVIAQTLLGDNIGTMEFNNHSDQSSVLNYDGERPFGKKSTSSITTLDYLVESLEFPSPDLIKFDLQGYELNALRGAEKCVHSCTFIELEVSFFAFQEQQPILLDVIQHLDEIGFRLYDIMGLWQRPLDGALGQGDFLFISKNSNLIASNSWS